MFHFNTERYDFWGIYESINRFYPLGIRKEDAAMFYSYPGFKLLSGIIIDNIHNEKHFIERWEKVTSEMGIRMGMEIIGTTYGQAPSFSSFILMHKESIGNLVKTKELHFFISLIGPFYSIIGQENIEVNLEADGGTFRSTNYVVVSPELDFAETFKLLSANIEEQFKGYRFVPYEICKQSIEGLDVYYADDKLNTVFYALFNNQVDLSVKGIVGNTFFKSEDWTREGYAAKEERWTGNSPF